MIYYLTLENLEDETILNDYIYSNMTENYYWSDDYSPEFYVKAAKCGFITTSMYQNDMFILLPEIQFSYAVLDFDEIIIPSKVNKLIKENKYKLTINERFDEVLQKIKTYHKDSWIKDEYINIITQINKIYNQNKDFKFYSAELVEKETNLLISGEIGYQVGSTYTSLTGFTTKDKKYNNCGKLQLVLLNYYLKENNFKLWNLGHPQLQYKIDLGAKVYNRKDFLKLWKDNL